MKIKVSKHKLNIYYRGSLRGSRTQQHAYCLRYAHSQHIESHLGKKQQQAKIPITFLFSQLHFNGVTSHALFYGGHLVMRSKRCAVQNQVITLNGALNDWTFEWNKTIESIPGRVWSWLVLIRLLSRNGRGRLTADLPSGVRILHAPPTSHLIEERLGISKALTRALKGGGEQD